MVTDDELIEGMFSQDPSVASLARRMFDARHPGPRSPVREPAHCAECFEGCSKCQPQPTPPKGGSGVPQTNR